MKGYVYIISNKAMPGLFKIGYTDRDPEDRARELKASTGIPYDYDVDYEILVDNPFRVEQEAHSKLREFNEAREWFRCSIGKCINAIKSCCHGRIYYERYIREEIEESLRKEKIYQEQLRRDEEFRKKEKKVIDELWIDYVKREDEYIKRKIVGDSFGFAIIGSCIAVIIACIIGKMLDIGVFAFYGFLGSFCVFYISKITGSKDELIDEFLATYKYTSEYGDDYFMIRCQKCLKYYVVRAIDDGDDVICKKCHESIDYESPQWVKEEYWDG